MNLIIIFAIFDLLNYLRIVRAVAKLLLKKDLIVIQFAGAINVVVTDIAPK